MDWQPIETAPKNGQKILLANRRRNHAKGWRMYVGYWATGSQPTRWAAFPATTKWIEPSHWQSLPEPPTDTGETEESAT